MNRPGEFLLPRHGSSLGRPTVKEQWSTGWVAGNARLVIVSDVTIPKTCRSRSESIRNLSTASFKAHVQHCGSRCFILLLPARPWQCLHRILLNHAWRVMDDSNLLVTHGSSWELIATRRRFGALTCWLFHPFPTFATVFWVLGATLICPGEPWWTVIAGYCCGLCYLVFGESVK